MTRRACLMGAPILSVNGVAGHGFGGQQGKHQMAPDHGTSPDRDIEQTLFG